MGHIKNATRPFRKSNTIEHFLKLIVYFIVYHVACVVARFVDITGPLRTEQTQQVDD